MAKTPESLDLLVRDTYRRTFDASLEAVRQAGLKLGSHDVGTGDIKADAGMAANSWGEIIAIHISEEEDGVRVRIVSTAKLFMGSNRHQRHLAGISESLSALLGRDAVVAAGPISHGTAPKVAREGEISRATGANGTVVLFDNRVVIFRAKTLSTAILHGLKGDKEIRLAKIASVQLRKPGLLAGYIQFESSGGGTSQKGILDATQDENTVMFGASQWDTFVKFKMAVDAAIDRADRPSTSVPQPLSAVEQLKQWKELLDAGAVTQEEFDVQKRKILG